MTGAILQAETYQAKTYSVETYLAMEEASDIRHEFRNGEVVAMAGGTPEHNEIARMSVFLLTTSLRQQPYSIFVSDQRLWIPAKRLHTYPDVMVIPRPVELEVGRNDTVVNPILIAEILSKSTQGYDRGEKFEAYQTIDSFREYLLIDQYRPQVEHYVKQGADQWLLTIHRDLEASLSLASVPVLLTLAELYEAITFKNSEATAEHG